MFRVNVIRGGDVAANALIYRPPDNALLEYLNNSINSAIEHTSSLSDRFVSTVRGMYDKFNSSAAIAASKALLYNAGMHFNQDTIYPVSYDNLSTANLAMQRYIMAQPLMSNLYKKNMCYGFQNTYLNMEPETYGKDRLEYQRVMDGVLQHDKNGDAYIMHYSNDDYVDELHVFDKLSVLDTWNNVARMIANGYDPSDPEQGDL